MEHTRSGDPVITYLKNYTNTDIGHFSKVLKSHPEYPSFAAIFHALDFFSIATDIYEAELEDLDKECNSFFAILNDNYGSSYISHIARKGNKFYADTDQIRPEELGRLWSGTIFLIQKEKKTFGFLQLKKPAVFMVLSAVFCLSTILINLNDGQKYIFYLLTYAGIFLSVVSINIELNLIPSLNAFCQTKKKTDCNSVITSNKLKFLSYLKFSEISFAFFLTQLVFLFTSDFGIININSAYISFSFPFIAFSIYYQLFAVKKRCTICLLISSILILEFVLLQNSSRYYIEISYFLTFFAVQITLLLVVGALRTLKIENIRSAEKMLRLKRFLNKPASFKQLYSNQKEIKINYDYLFFEAKPVNITIVTDPFCNQCKKAHVEFISVLKGISDDLYDISVIFNTTTLDEAGKELELYLTMIEQQRDDKKKFYFEHLTFWFEHRNLKDWSRKFQNIPASEAAGIVLDNQYEWCKINKIVQTPTVLLNGKVLPPAYDIADLNFILPYFTELEIEGQRNPK